MKKIFLSAAILLAGVVHAQETARFKEISKNLVATGSPVVMIAAHRGVHNDAPENSATAFLKGVELGIDIIELDVRHTKDDSLVVMHDRTVDRTTNGKGLVSDLSFEEIRKLRLKFKGTLTDEKVLTLAEALDLLKGKIMIDLDIKTDRIEDVLKVVERTGAMSSCLFFLGEAEHAKMLKAKNPTSKTLVKTHSEAEVDHLFSITQSEAVHIDDNHYTTAVVTKIKNNGGRVWINALDDTDKAAAGGNTAAYGELLKKGANIIQTDYPALLQEYLKTHGR